MGFAASVRQSLVKTEQTGVLVYLQPFSIPQPHGGGLFLLPGFYAVKLYGNEIFLAGVISTGN